MKSIGRPAQTLLLVLAIMVSQAPVWPQEVRDIRKIPRVEPRIVSARPGHPVGDSVMAQLILRNPSTSPVEVAEECLRPSAFRVRRFGKAESARARKDRGPEPLTLAPGQTVRHTYDLRRHFKEFRKTGHFRVSWHCGSWKTPIQHFFVVEPYNPETDKVARISTALGDLDLVLLAEQAPLHVQTFAELARAGYYDGLYFERLVPGFQIEVGDRAETRQGRWDHQLPPEIDRKISPGKGLVGAVRRQSSMTSATRFFILLDSAPSFTGLHTFFAYVRSGGEVLDALGSRGVLGNAGAGAFVMREPVLIEKVEILPE